MNRRAILTSGAALAALSASGVSLADEELESQADVNYPESLRRALIEQQYSTNRVRFDPSLPNACRRSALIVHSLSEAVLDLAVAKSGYARAIAQAAANASDECRVECLRHSHVYSARECADRCGRAAYELRRI